ncbi:UvrB/UvrC motif-containing protein [Pseudoalteromonas maricaloris]|nr:UvrB/UvrC motif-containing protein [Pseudoalteromonas flavipulchra]MBE0371821.1 hypothetical protein [Pseudoalteromonas flavipulchra NCIMB 2033 = ATCC BAA-314]
MDLGEEVADDKVVDIDAKFKPGMPAMDAKEIAKEIDRLEAQMMKFAKELEFEKAAQARDQVQILQKRLIKA